MCDMPLARLYGVRSYYVRVAPRESLTRIGAPSIECCRSATCRSTPDLPVSAQVSVDFLQLVRFGLRRADDPLILGTVRSPTHC